MKASESDHRELRLPTIVAWFLIVSVVCTLGFQFGLFSGPIVVPAEFEAIFKAAALLSKRLNPYQETGILHSQPSPGLLVAIGWLPSTLVSAWTFFLSISLICFSAALIQGFRYRTWKAVLFLMIGLGGAWGGIREGLHLGQMDLIVLGVAVFAGFLFPVSPVIAGVMIGLLPAIKLPWAVLFFPFAWKALSFPKRSPPSRKREHSFRQFFSGYVLGWFIWAAALPSLRMGPELGKEISQTWVQLLRTQPEILYLSELNQSLTSTLFRIFGSSSNLWVYAIALLIAGWLLGIRLSKSRSLPGQTYPLAWLSPWLVFTQLINPLGWRWGSVYVIGIPLSAYFSYRSERSHLKWGLGFLAVGLWIAQQVSIVGSHHYGLVTAYWLTLIFLA